eukprot:scaffold23587_cov122-Cylindrotheca_fusiformis.AAC.1
MSDEQSLSSKKSHFTQISLNTSSHDASESTSKRPTPEREAYQPPEVAKREELNILRAKILVAVIILLAVCGVGSATYILVKDQERANFENEFAGYASEILTVSRQKADQLFLGLDAFSASIESQAASENALRNTSWPFYTVPDWSIKAQKLARLTGVSDATVSLYPIVQIDEMDEFNAFAAQAVPKWYQESVENENTDMTAEEFWSKTIPFIFTITFDSEKKPQLVPPTGINESIPVLQTYPLMFDQELGIMTTMYERATLGGFMSQVSIARALRKPTIGFTALLDGVSAVPGSQIMQPIYDTAHIDSGDNKMVAVTLIRLNWLDYFKNLLTKGESGVVVVLEGACSAQSAQESLGQEVWLQFVMSYRIEGLNAEYLGDSDLHDPKYNGMEVEDIFVDLGVDESQLPEGSCVPVMTLHVYPSEDLEKSFQTNNSVIYTAVVAVIFIFTSLVFLLYDYFVRRRQTKVMERIVRQDKIVANVFPTAIRDRLYQSQQKQKNNRDLQGDLNDGFEEIDFEGESGISGAAPLADLFPSITVVFADIAGFTAWSSAREPQQVFVLLETIYGAFDKIAYRHSVFKVETVGDCYVGAVGLPEPVDNHATVACKFARDCLKTMKEVTLKLEVTLGPDTGDLDLRTGIHR